MDSKSPRTLALGPKLKSTRKERKMSLRELGAVTGFSASFLSQVERGEASPSLSSLDKIVRALGITLAGILSEPRSETAGPLVRRKDQDTLRSEWSRALLKSLMPPGSDERLAAFLVQLDPEGRTGRHFLSDYPAIFGFCLKGRPTLVLDGQIHQLGQQDSVYYDGSRLAVWENQARTPAELLLVAVRK